MKTQVLFIQGGGEGTYDAWDDKLVESLRRELGDVYDVRYPRMPDEADPRYAAWKAAIADALGDLDQGAMVVGHSIGGTILIHALVGAAPKQELGGIFLVAAPFVGKGGWPAEDITPKCDLGTRLQPQTPVYLYHGTADETAPVSHVDLYSKAIPGAVVRRLEGRDHQLNNDLAEVAADIRALRARTDRFRV